MVVEGPLTSPPPFALNVLSFSGTAGFTWSSLSPSRPPSRLSGLTRESSDIPWSLVHVEPTTYNYAEYFRLVPETAATLSFSSSLRWAVFEPATTCESVFPHKRNDCKFSTVKYLDGMMINWELQNTPTTDHSRTLPKDIIIQVIQTQFSRAVS
jgi:hypothetical protein